MSGFRHTPDRRARRLIARPLALLASLILAPGAGLAQPAGPIQRIDLTGAVGSFSSRHLHDDPYDQWGTSALATLTGGYYWTDHLKTEVEVGWTGERRVFGSEPAGRDLPPFVRIFQEHTYRSTLLSLAQAWQGGRNVLFHPFVSGGLTIDRERHVVDRPAQILPLTNTPAPPTRFIPRFESTETTVRMRAFTTVGFKAYFTPRGFFRSDLSLGFDRGLHHVTWRAGVGVDFK